MNKEGFEKVLEMLKTGYFDNDAKIIALLSCIAECLADIADTLREGKDDGR